MSLSIYLNNPETGEELYSCNITHNLGKMADANGIYYHLWRPDEIDMEFAHQIEPTLTTGVAHLATNKGFYEQFNSPNGWGMYDHFLIFCVNYLKAVREHPSAKIEISR
jgi:hypothetical protein